MTNNEQSPQDPEINIPTLRERASQFLSGMLKRGRAESPKDVSDSSAIIDPFDQIIKNEPELGYEMRTAGADELSTIREDVVGGFDRAFTQLVVLIKERGETSEQSEQLYGNKTSKNARIILQTILKTSSERLLAEPKLAEGELPVPHVLSGEYINYKQESQPISNLYSTALGQLSYKFRGTEDGKFPVVPESEHDLGAFSRDFAANIPENVAFTAADMEAVKVLAGVMKVSVSCEKDPDMLLLWKSTGIGDSFIDDLHPNDPPKFGSES